MERDVTIITIFIIRKISTHTLTWSVTILYHVATQISHDFNSHAHVERD